jgi:ribosomal protein S18 acetylase RimI-like enzyme
MTVALRPELPSAESGDEAFIRALILDTVAAELGAASWPAPLRSHLLGMQYQNRRHIEGREPGDASRIILLEGEPVGWLYTVTAENEILLVEIMVREEHRGKGIGASVIRGLLTEAGRTGRPLRLRVNVTNERAIRLYERLGFRRTGGDPVQHEMVARP